MRDFFEHQAAAQRRTRVLLACLLLAVLAMGSTAFGFACLVRWLLLTRFPPVAAWRPGPIFAWCVGGTAALVALASLFRMLSLRRGGAEIAAMLEARLVSGQPRDELEQRLLNVVTEMALAAGTQVPQVFVLDHEPGINALAAGWTLSDSIICTTRGCLEKLTRAELQGVIAHELSHILHGDARLNLRLMGTVYGIVSIGLIGRQLMNAGRTSERRSAFVWLLGLAIAVVGAIGGALGRLVKAAVSRQREYLADAAAVQYTRHPEGIARALKKIGGHEFGSRIFASRAAEASHFFFSAIESKRFDDWAWLSTHPSLTDRLARIDPSFDGRAVAPSPGIAEEAHEANEANAPARVANAPRHAVMGHHGLAAPYGEPQASQHTQLASGSRPPPQLASHPASGDGVAVSFGEARETEPVQPARTSLQPTPFAPQRAANSNVTAERDAPSPAALQLMAASFVSGVGQVDTVTNAQAWLERADPSLAAACQSGFSASALVFAMLVGAEKGLAVRQARRILELAGQPLLCETQRLYDAVARTSRPDRLALTNMASPALRALSPAQGRVLRRTVDALIAEDGATSIFEHVLATLLARCSSERHPVRRTRPLAAHLRALELVLSALAHTGAAFEDSASNAFAAGAARLPGLALTLLPQTPRLLSGLGPALDELRDLRPLACAALVDACAHTVLADNRETDDEVTVLRVVCLALDVPLRPATDLGGSGAREASIRLGASESVSG